MSTKHDLSDARDDIHALAGMRIDGLLTEKQFETKKTKVLNRSTSHWWKFW